MTDSTTDGPSTDGPTADELTAQLRAAMPLCGLLGMRVIEQRPDEVHLAMDWDAETCTVGGAMHGGALMALADATGAMAAFLNLPEGAGGTTTIESKTNFLGAARGGTIHAVARPLHAGRTTVVVETELRCEDGKLVTKTTQTQAVLAG